MSESACVAVAALLLVMACVPDRNRLSLNTVNVCSRTAKLIL